MRYDQLQVLINAHKPSRILEVGTWNGHRAMSLMSQALKMCGRVHYVGFDLFEDATEESDARELNVKTHNAFEDVKSRLAAFCADNEGATFEIHKGDTCETLPGWIAGAKEACESAGIELGIDLAFIDGGHSVETIRSDYENLKNYAACLVLDDFYSPDDNDVMPNIGKYGCNSLVEEIGNCFLMPQADPVAGGGRVQMVVTPRDAWPENQNVVVKTKNCVPDVQIQANIFYSSKMIDKWLEPCKEHERSAMIVAGGPSYKDHLDEIKNHDGEVFCVKSSHDFLIENDIVPWGCLLLDPRPHVLDFIKDPHEDIRYIVASMCHPISIWRVVESKARVYGYHAHVGAGEEDAIKQMFGGGHIIGGGSTAALRGVSVLHSLGYRKFKLVGFDSCYAGPDEQVHGVKKDKPIFQVEVNGAKFWTDPELLAQGQDFVKLLEISDGLDLEVIGPGMIAHVWKTSGFGGDKKYSGDFEKLFAD